LANDEVYNTNEFAVKNLNVNVKYLMSNKDTSEYNHMADINGRSLVLQLTVLLRAACHIKPELSKLDAITNLK
jgi:hypothetical protein